MTNNSYLGLTAHQLLVAELGAQNSIPRDGEIPRILPGIGTSSYVPSTSLYAPQQPLPPSGHPPISTGYSPKPYSGNYQSRRGRGNVLSNLISPRATSSDFLPVTLRFLPDKKEEMKWKLCCRGSLAGDFIAIRVASQLKLDHHIVTNKSRTVCSGLVSKRYDISNTLSRHVSYYNQLLKNVACFKINAIILESSPIVALYHTSTYILTYC